MTDPCIERPFTVVFGGGFYDEGEGACEELWVKKTFQWKGERWYVPCLYLFEEGVVLDLCRRRTTEEPSWFSATLTINGRECDNGEIHNAWYDPAEPEDPYEEADPFENPVKMAAVYYGLDNSDLWELLRYSFSWERRMPLTDMTLTLAQDPVPIEAAVFTTPSASNAVTFQNPVTGKSHVLTILGTEQQTLPKGSFSEEKGLLYPDKFTAMEYHLEPPIKETFSLEDCERSDQPRRIPTPPGEKAADPIAAKYRLYQPTAVNDCIVMMVPPAGSTQKDGSSTACSALHFEPVETVTWKLSVCGKTVADCAVNLIGD